LLQAPAARYPTSQVGVHNKPPRGFATHRTSTSAAGVFPAGFAHTADAQSAACAGSTGGGIQAFPASFILREVARSAKAGKENDPAPQHDTRSGLGGQGGPTSRRCPLMRRLFFLAIIICGLAAFLRCLSKCLPGWSPGTAYDMAERTLFSHCPPCISHHRPRPLDGGPQRQLLAWFSMRLFKARNSIVRPLLIGRLKKYSPSLLLCSPSVFLRARNRY